MFSSPRDAADRYTNHFNKRKDEPRLRPTQTPTSTRTLQVQLSLGSAAIRILFKDLLSNVVLTFICLSFSQVLSNLDSDPLNESLFKLKEVSEVEDSDEDYYFTDS